VVHGQAPQPAPAPGAVPGVAAGDLGALTRVLADRVRELGDAIASELGKTPAGATLLQDTRELAQAVDEFRLGLPGAPDALRRRQLYSGIDATWHHLLRQLGKPGASSPKVDAAARRVGEVDAQIHKVLGLNAFPAIYYGTSPSPGGMPEIQRLARALVDRAEALLSAVRADMRGPVGSRLAEEVTSLVQAADIFHDGINLDSRPDDTTRNGFAGVAAASDLLAADLNNLQLTNRVRAAWQSYRTTETLMRQALKLPVPQADLGTSAIPLNGRTPVLALADRLVAQLDDFLVAFTPEAGGVPEGGSIIADARRLRAAAADFRDAIPRAIDVGQLAYAFRDVDALWEILARRINRIAQGRTGPNVQRIEGIGQTIAEIHGLLGMPGSPATVGPFAGPG
jgi:hypothetical protein